MTVVSWRITILSALLTPWKMRADINQIREVRNNEERKSVNILIILADDLGYGDTSVHPFIGTGILTPQLEKMASRGVVTENFHSAAATCTPTRASILTGLYPWRLGIKAVFEYGVKGKSNRDDWLAQIPTAPMIFRDSKYKTGHSGSRRKQEPQFLLLSIADRF
jgi:arylsulfatase A-like enzyme